MLQQLRVRAVKSANDLSIADTQAIELLRHIELIGRFNGKLNTDNGWP